MFSFSNPNIIFASAADVEAIRNLLNAAYRGESSKQGWTTEAGLISGNTRTNDAMVREVIEQGASVILIYKEKLLISYSRASCSAFLTSSLSLSSDNLDRTFISSSLSKYYHYLVKGNCDFYNSFLLQ